jgi:regulator of sigma E protease
MNLFTIIISILILCFLILIHELGHFFAAKISGVKVEEFAVGFGPPIYKKQGKETLYSIRLILLGGFCRMLGEETEEDDDKSYSSKSKPSKIFILVAGSLMNIIFAVVFFILAFISIGYGTNVIDTVVENYPMDVAGIASGDEIIAINNYEINSFEDISNIVDYENESQYIIDVKDSNGDTVSSYEVTSQYDNEQERYVLGMSMVIDHSLIYAVPQGINMTYEYTVEMYKFLGSFFIGQGDVNNVQGPIGIVSVVDQMIGYGIGAMFFLTAMISLNLGIINLLPIPALDGSKILILIIEGAIGKDLSVEKENMIHYFGFLLLIVLAILVAFNDISRLI